MMAVTATDLTRDHYQRPEVKEIIGKYAMPGDGAWRALNGDFHHWYGYLEDGRARLLHSGDYDDLTERHRTLYQTLNIFEPALREVARPREEITADNPLGSPADTVGYSLAVDIDKGPGCDIEAPEVKQAVESAAQFLADFLKERGVRESIWPAFSGGGIYLVIHHEICRPASLNPKDRVEFFRALTDRFNRLIAHASEEFFKAHPEYIGKVKYDVLNNSKRVFKCILSIHKKKPYAVTPLNKDSIKIDFERARIPLKDDMIAEARAWYSTYSAAEREPLLRLLDEFMPADDEERSSSRQFKEVWRSPFKVDPKYFPPCIRHLVNTSNPGEGKTRFTAVLSIFLFQAGWPEEEAWNLVKEVSDRNGLDNADHIFDSCFGRISCPSCQKIQTDAAGYPHLGLKGLGACEPLEECGQWPGDYAVSYALGDVQTATKEQELKADGPTVLDAFAALLQHEAEISRDTKFDRWSWRLHKSKIKRAVNSGKLTRKGEEKAHRFLEKYKKFLMDYEIDYEDLYPIPRPAKSKQEEFDWRTKAKAWKILRTGNPLQYIADSCGRVVLGSEASFKKLTCCISAQNINQTAGLHPKLNGDSSGGKTITAYCFAHHLPKEMVIKGSMSNKAGFYHNDGDRVLRILDDYIAGNEDLDTVIKQTSSEFHVPYQHRTVIRQAPATLSIGREQTWAITSVDSSQDIQVLNRQLPINTDDSIGLTEKVNKRTIERYAQGEEQLPLDEKVLICRAIFQILRDQDKIGVRIPFRDRIEWLDTSNRRNPSLFMDLMISITAINRYQREQDAEGYYLATVDDFKTAKALFTDKDAEELVKRLTARERDVIDLLIGNSDGLTRDDIAAKLKVAPQRVTQIIHGQKGYGGLGQKVQIAESKVSVSIRTGNPETDDTRRTVHKVVYSLKDYDQFTGFDAVVRLKPSDPEPEPAEPSKQSKHGESTEVSKEIITGKVKVSKVSIKKSKYNNNIERDSKLTFGSLSQNENFAYLLTSRPADSESQYFHRAYPCLPCLPPSADSGIKADLRRVEAERKAIDDFRSVAEEEKKPPFSEDYLNEVLVCRKIRKALSEGVTDPYALSSICGLPVCLISKFPGVNSIGAAEIQAKLEAHRKELHFQKVAEQITQRQRLQIIYIPKGAAGEYSGLAFNPWIGCGHGCKYCYGPAHFHKTREEYSIPVLKKDMLQKLECDLKLIVSGVPLLAKRGEEWIEVSAKQRSDPVFIMFSGDLYFPPWQHSDLPRKILELFNKYKVPFDILTKGGMKAVQDFDLYIAGCRFWTTLTFDNEEDSRKWEPGAALPEDRIDAMQIAHERGIKTCVSFEPVLDPEQTLHLMDQTAPFRDDCFVGKLNTTRKNLPIELEEIERQTDWPKFKIDAINRLERSGKPYKIKIDLLKAAEPVQQEASA